MNLVNAGVKTEVSERWCNCSAIIDPPTPGTHERSAKVYIGGLKQPPVCVKFIWNPTDDVKLDHPNRKRGLETGERHVLALIQAGTDGTFVLKQISTRFYAVDVYAA